MGSIAFRKRSLAGDHMVVVFNDEVVIMKILIDHKVWEEKELEFAMMINKIFNK